MSMSNACLPTFELGLNALAAILKKAEAHAQEKKFDAGVLLNTRLFPDMWALVRQVQTACDVAKNGGARLAGLDRRARDDTEGSPTVCAGYSHG
jgi:hypothetical protein